MFDQSFLRAIDGKYRRTTVPLEFSITQNNSRAPAGKYGPESKMSIQRQNNFANNFPMEFCSRNESQIISSTRMRMF